MRKLFMILGSLALTTTVLESSIASLSPTNSVRPKEETQTKIHLQDVLTKPKLGILETNELDEFLELLKFNNPKIETKEVEVKKISNQLATISPIKNSEVYQQTMIGVPVEFEIKAKVELKKVIQNSQLGEISAPQAPVILKKLEELNPKLNLDYLEVRANTITNTGAVVKATLNGGFKGEVFVDFQIPLKNITEDLEKAELGFLINNDESTIFDALWDANPNLVTSEIKIQNIKPTSCEVVVNENSTVYHPQDKVLISFTTAANSLKDDLKNLNWGEINDNSIQEIKKELQAKTKVNIQEVEIFQITGLSFKIQAKETSHYYRVEEPLLVSFTLPQKMSLSQISYFKWINYRSQEEIIQQIQDLIIQTTQKTQIEYLKDFEIEGLDNYAKDKSELTLIVKAITSSKHLTGKFEFSFVSPFSLTRYSDDVMPELPEENEKIKNEIKEKINSDLKEAQINEDVDEILESLTFSKTEFYTFTHLSKKYYRNLTMNVKENQILTGTINWTNIIAPNYNTNEIKINTSNSLMISFVDSTGDASYPDLWFTQYINSNHNPTRAYWDTTEVQTFSSIYYQKDFNLTKSEFFKKYNIELTYRYAINAWVNNGSGWKYSEGKERSFTSATKIFESESNTGTAKTNSKEKVYNANGYDHWDGDFGSKYKGAGAVQIFMEIDSEKIEIKGVVGSWFDWNNGSVYHHAGFARLQAKSLQIVPK